MQSRLKQLVWSSGCTSWALDPKTGLNIAMYPQYQFFFWLRSIFIPKEDFEYEYRDGKSFESKTIAVGGWKSVQKFISTLVVLTVAGGLGVQRVGGLSEASIGVSNALWGFLDAAARKLKA